VAVRGQEERVDFNDRMEERKSPTRPPTAENPEVIDLEALM
jgi:hypothetical protein